MKVILNKDITFKADGLEDHVIKAGEVIDLRRTPEDDLVVICPCGKKMIINDLDIAQNVLDSADAIEAVAESKSKSVKVKLSKVVEEVGLENLEVLADYIVATDQITEEDDPEIIVPVNEYQVIEDASIEDIASEEPVEVVADDEIIGDIDMSEGCSKESEDEESDLALIDIAIDALNKVAEHEHEEMMEDEPEVDLDPVIGESAEEVAKEVELVKAGDKAMSDKKVSSEDGDLDLKDKVEPAEKVVEEEVEPTKDTEENPVASNGDAPVEERDADPVEPKAEPASEGDSREEEPTDLVEEAADRMDWFKKDDMHAEVFEDGYVAFFNAEDEKVDAKHYADKTEAMDKLEAEGWTKKDIIDQEPVTESADDYENGYQAGWQDAKSGLKPETDERLGGSDDFKDGYHQGYDDYKNSDN